MKTPINLLRAALAAIPAGDRELWLRIGMALKSELPGDDGLELFDAWSQSAENYDAKAVRSTWRSFKVSGGITVGTLFHEAKARGWKPEPDSKPPSPTAEELAMLKKQRAETEARVQAQRDAEQRSAAKTAAELWAAALDAGASPYLERKRVGAHGVRFNQDGTLLVPLRDAAGELWNVQSIAPCGEKRFLHGGRVKGCMHWCGDPAGADWLLIAEGYATAATLHEATGLPVGVGFNAGNLVPVASAIRERFPDARILVCADDDSVTAAKTGKNPGIEAAKAAAKAKRTHWIKPEGLTAGETDFNDLSARVGLDVIATQVRSAIAAIKTKNQKSAAGAPERSAKPYFRVDDGGVWYHGFDDRGDPRSPLWICSHLQVTAKTRDADDAEWGYLLDFNDADGNPKAWAMPARMLAGDGTEYRSVLLSMGLRIATTAAARALLTQYIQTRTVDGRARCVDRIGWHGHVFVLPTRTIGDNDERVIFQSSGQVSNQFKQRDTLTHWRERISALCVGNSRLLFMVSCAFAGPLMRLAGVESGGFHFRGGSSSGKTTALRVAASVYGGESYMQLWRATDNALEAIAAQYCDTLLILDEIAQLDPKAAGECAYLLANESGKARASRAGGALRARLTWRILFLSAGESGLAERMAEANKTANTGQELRLADVPIDAGADLGVFNTLHDFANGSVLAKHLTRECKRIYGVAGAAFFEWVVPQADALAKRTRDRIAELVRAWVPVNASGQAERVATRFAVAAVAGELASEAGVTGWPKGDAEAGVRTCFLAWLEARGGAGKGEQLAILRQVRGFVQAHADRFVWWHRVGDDHRPNVMNQVGFRRLIHQGKAIDSNKDHYAEFGDKMHPEAAEDSEVECYVYPEAFRKEMCSGFDHRAVGKLLIDRGYLMPGENGRPDRKERLPLLGNVRCYRLLPKLLIDCE
jgi:putative DNA primase/helicase